MRLLFWNIWEEIFGALSPPTALALDIVLFGLALIVLLFHKEGFLILRSRFTRRKGEGML